MRLELRDLPSKELKPEMGPELKHDTAILFYLLEDDRLYTCATATATRIDRTLEPKRYNRMRARILSYATYRKMSESPDGKIYGNPAWLGKTFKEAMGDRSFYRASGHIELLKALVQVREAKLSKEIRPPEIEESALTCIEVSTPHPVARPRSQATRYFARFRWWAAIAALISLAFLLQKSRSQPQPDFSASIQEFSVQKNQAALARELSGMLVSLSNFTGSLPADAAHFTIENLGSQPATVLMVSHNEAGEQIRRNIFLEAGEAQDIQSPGEEVNGMIYFLSLQNFTLTTRSPVSLGGPPTRRLSVKSASAPMTLRQIEMAGDNRTIGIDFEGKVHYPVYGCEIGRWDGRKLIPNHHLPSSSPMTP